MANKYSIHKIAWFPKKLEALAAGKVTAPIYVRIKPTNVCNMDCWWCIYKHSFSGMHELSPDRETDYHGTVAQLPKEKLWEIIEDLAEMGVKAVTFSGGGEPLMHPAITEIMQHTLDLGIDLSIITNGQLLTGPRAEILGRGKWVRVSVDYNTPEQLQEFRHVDPRFFAAVLANLKAFSKTKDPACDLFINYIVHRKNFSGLTEAAKLFKAHGVENIRFSPMWTPDFLAYHDPIKDEVGRQLREIQEICDSEFTVNSTYDIEASAHSTVRAYDKCLFCQIVPVIAADGNVYSCHNKAYDPKGMIGSIKDRKFSALWFSDEAKAFFDRLDPTKDCRHQCAADEKNLLYHQIVGARDNFI